MVGIIRRREQIKEIPFNPDDCFDPTTHIATEENFMKLLDNGIYDSKYIGYKVQLSNSVDYNNGIWVIADVNHDSTNTGQSNCYDLISQNCFHSGIFGSNQNWRSSTPRTWLNNTFYPGFSTEFKNHVLNPKYNSQGTWYADDKIILPSWTEFNGNVPTDYSSSTDVEGVKYPIFTDNASRSSNNQYWIRTRLKGNSNGVWFFYSGGAPGNDFYSNSRYLRAALRVS